MLPAVEQSQGCPLIARESVSGLCSNSWRMATAWERAKRALATRLCISAPWAPRAAAPVGISSDDEEVERSPVSPPFPARRLSRSGSRSSTRMCAICLSGMRSGHGQALFTAECSHIFHFQCISSSVQHGNHVCPICRAVWRELPFQGPLPANARTNLVSSPRGQLPAFRAPEPAIFDDDERINVQSGALGGRQGGDASVDIMAYTEFPAVQRSVAQEAFDILVRLKAPVSPAAVSSRAAIDLVAVLDVGGSMAGDKLALMKRSMSFVIQSLGPDDRLCVVAFTFSAWRLFPLRKMTAFGRQQASRAIDFLTAGNGSDIADAVAKAARVLEDRQARNPVCGIILLSDGQEPPCRRDWRDHGAFVPCSIRPGSGHHVRIHAFCLGEDHDSAAMRAVAEMSGGTFSFIDAVGSIEEALAPCIGGLLGVVAQEIRLSVECAEHGVLITSIKSGGYASRVDGDGRGGFVDVGDLYADEDRDFLVTVYVPPALRKDSALIVPSCTYRAAVTMEIVRVEGDPVVVHRPAHRPVSSAMSREVERERHRVHAMEGMATARDAAEQGDFARAASILEQHRREIEPRAALSADAQTLALVAELREMQDRVVIRRRYEESGRAYILASLSSHTWQRATARGDSTELAGLTHTYQTPCMLDMLHRSQAILPEAVEELNRSPTPTLSPIDSPVGLRGVAP